MDRLNWANES